jgi:SAM-dependent methyltransferase
MPDFDERKYWLERHERLRGDMRSVGCMNRTPEDAAAALERTEGRLRVVLEAVCPERSGRSLLDFGCGVGRLAPLMRDLGFDYLGVDLSPVAIDQARTAHPSAAFEVADIVSFRTERRFDVIVVWSVLLHLVRDDDWTAALHNLANALADQGRIVLFDTVPEEPQRTAEHVNLRTRDTYRRWLPTVGLRLSEEWLATDRDALAAASGLTPGSLGNFYLIERR